MKAETLEDNGARDALQAARNSVANLREQVAKLKAQKDALWDEHVSKANHAYANAKIVLSGAEDDLRALQLEHPTVTVDGVTIKEFATLDYPEQLGLAYAVEHQLQECLTLNKKVFDKIAPTLFPEICREDTELRVQIAQNFTRHLEDKKSEHES